MSYKQEDRVVLDNIRRLITLITKYEETHASFGPCEHFALNSIRNHRFLSVDSHAVKKSMAGLVEKFKIHGHFQASKNLHNLYEDFINQPVFQDDLYDLKWSLLSLLIFLAYNPTSVLNNNIINASKLSVLLPKNEITQIDWKNILSEGLQLRESYETDSLSSWSESESDSPEPSLQLSELSHLDLSLCVDNSYKGKSTGSKLSFENFENIEGTLQGTEWLPVDKLQPAWWALDTSYDAQSKFPGANLAREWNEYLKGLSYGIMDTEVPIFISEYCVIREVIWLMIAPQTPNRCRIFYRDEEDKFNVNKNITIPSLNPNTVRRLLTSFCSILTKLYEFDCFFEKVISVDIEKAPFTYKAYCECVEDLLNPLKIYLCDLEQQVKLQDDIFTLISLQICLKPHVKRLELLYVIHKDCILDWQYNSASACAVNLLTGLYNNCHMHNTEISNLSFILLINSMKVYLNIITSWLNSGRLKDWRDEFCIESNQYTDVQLQEFQLKSCPEQSSITINTFFKSLLLKVLYAGQSMNILLRLDRVHDILKKVQLKDNLHNIFKLEILREISQYDIQFQDHLSCDTISSPASEEAEKEQEFSLEVNDPLLRLFFQKKCDKRKRISYASHDINFYDFYERLCCLPQLPLKTILDKVLNSLSDNCMQPCKAVVDILRNDFDLQKHLDALQSIMLMHSSGSMFSFYNHLFNEIENGTQWKTPYYLTSQWEAFLSYSPYANIAHLFSIEFQESIKSLNNNLKGFVYLTVSYTVQYPLSLVISQDNLKKYQECMQFLLKVNWSYWGLQKLKFSNELRQCFSNFHSAEVTSRKLQMLRFWLLHSIGSIHSYLFGQVLNTAKINLHNKIESATAHEDLIAAHKEFIDNIYENCLLVPKYAPIQKIILQLLKLVQLVRAEWAHRFENRNSDDSDNVHFDGLSDLEHIENMEYTYHKCHSYLQKTFKSTPCTEDNNLYGLCFAFDCNAPKLHLFTL